MIQAGIKAIRGYKRHRSFTGGNVHHIAENTLQRQFDVVEANN